MQSSVFQKLSAAELDQIKALATKRHYPANTPVFAEGDSVDNIYFIESGTVSITMQQFAAQKEIARMESGDYFGEMAVFYDGKRTASATTAKETTLFCIEKNDFLKLLAENKELAATINQELAIRNEEHTLKEQILQTTGINSDNLHIGIKGDPSLRESAFERERYQSVVDQVLPQLLPQLEDLLCHRAAYQIVIHFNSGEIHTWSVFDPFTESIHPANKMTTTSYLDRHFPHLAYADKLAMIQRIYRTITQDTSFSGLSDHFKKMTTNHYEQWQPLTEAEIVETLERLKLLRDIQNFYLRNFTLSVIRHTIRMQFNCDGTHIINTDYCEQFIEDNL